MMFFIKYIVPQKFYKTTQGNYCQTLYGYCWIIYDSFLIINNNTIS